jgi:hypothetical protein
MSAGRVGGVILSALAACGNEGAKAMVANPANTTPAMVKLLIVLNNFDFNFLYNILFSPYLPCGASACRAFGDRPQRLIRCELIADHLTTRPPFY